MLCETRQRSTFSRPFLFFHDDRSRHVLKAKHGTSGPLISRLCGLYLETKLVVPRACSFIQMTAFARGGRRPFTSGSLPRGTHSPGFPRRKSENGEAGAYVTRTPIKRQGACPLTVIPKRFYVHYRKSYCQICSLPKYNLLPVTHVLFVLRYFIGNFTIRWVFPIILHTRCATRSGIHRWPIDS